MKWVKMLEIFALLTIIASMIPSCKAMIEKEYNWECKDLLYDATIYAFKLKLVIETEENGVWIKGKSYTITFILNVDFINFSYFDALNFSSWDIYTNHPNAVHFSEYNRIAYKLFGQGGFIISYPEVVVEFKAFPVEGGRIDIFPRMSIVSIGSKNVGGRGVVVSGWDCNEPIYIDITDKLITNQIDEIRNLIYILILTTMILIAITCYITIKKAKAVVSNPQTPS